MSEALNRAREKYDAENTVQIKLKLNKKTDAEILAKLAEVDNKQGYIKKLILKDIAVKTLESKHKWTLISEELPKDGFMYLFTDGYNISVERYKSDVIDHFYPEGRWFSLEEVVAWMPLPELNELFDK